MLSKEPFPSNEAGREQIPPALRPPYREVCMPKNEMEI